jgi:hypothetical protein
MYKFLLPVCLLIQETFLAIMSAIFNLKCNTLETVFCIGGVTDGNRRTGSAKAAACI